MAKHVIDMLMGGHRERRAADGHFVAGATSTMPQPSRRLAAVVGASQGLPQVPWRTHSVQPMAVRATA